MSPSEVRVQPSLCADLADELERGGGRWSEIARQLRRGWTEDGVRAALAEQLSWGVFGHNPEVGFWWVA
jgi:hypothetical protein